MRVACVYWRIAADTAASTETVDSTRGGQRVPPLINEKGARFFKHLVELLGGHFSTCLKAHALLYREKSLRTNEAGLTDLAAFAIAAVERNGESIPVRAGRDLAKN